MFEFYAFWLDVITNLFHVVVDIDDISTNFIRYLTIDKGGRMTFIPLNCVWPPHVNYPIGLNFVPLLKKFKCNLKFGPTFAKVHGVLGFFIVFFWLLLSISFHLFLRN
jgi:structural maintenance of chromosome 3 (chondroitin sulfate proteoglycan 6)